MNKTPESKPVGKVISIREAIIERSRLANEHEWNGEFGMADQLYAEIEYLKREEKEGEVWVPLV